MLLYEKIIPNGERNMVVNKGSLSCWLDVRSGFMIYALVRKKPCAE